MKAQQEFLRGGSGIYLDRCCGTHTRHVSTEISERGIPAYSAQLRTIKLFLCPMRSFFF